MILRRVIDHFRKQEWTAIAIDFVIVVLGIFVGLQVSNWNENRGLEKRKAAAIERLHDESEAIVDYVADRVRFFATNNEATAEALRRLTESDWAGVDAQQTANAFGALGFAPAAAPPRSVYDELISTGLFAEVGDAKLREAVADYYANLSFLQAQIDYIRQVIIAESAQRRFPGIKVRYDREASRGQRFEFDFPALSADESFIEYAVSGNANQIAQRQWWTLTLIKAKAMCAEIARYDRRPCAPAAAGAEFLGASTPGADKESKP